MKKIYILLFLVCGLTVPFSCKHSAGSGGDSDSDSLLVDTVKHVYEYGICVDSLEKERYVIENGDNLSGIFMRQGFNAAQADSFSRHLSPVLDPTRLRVGLPYFTFSTGDTLKEIRYMVFAKSLTDYAVINIATDSVVAYHFQKPITLKRRYAEGTITSSLWNEIIKNGADPLLALKISDVFAWQIDFFDVKEGDAFRVSYDEAYIDDTTAFEIASINGAIFTHQGKDYVAIPFRQDSVSEYFDAEGGSLRRAFLKAPLDFFRIPSRFFNARFHPVPKRYRAHHGVDYAAPVGTPVKSIGDGTVVAKAYQAGGGGNYLKVKHNSVYTTSYMHLSRFAKGIAVGSHVQQGEVIGYVGSTGLSTGPHLDFRVYKNGQAINPLQMEAPPSLPVRAELLDSFNIVKTQVLAELDSFHVDFQQKSKMIQ